MHTSPHLATVIYDGKNFTLPSYFCQPGPHQLQGTDEENNIENAGRICYDSLHPTKGRSTPEYHQHILEVGHTSVCAHATFTLDIQCFFMNLENRTRFFEAFLNRPGCFILPGSYATYENYIVLSVNMNLRVLTDWHKMTKRLHPNDHQDPLFEQIRAALCSAVKHRFPHILTENYQPAPLIDALFSKEPTHPEELFVSLHLRMSRACSHEWVRHSFRAAISQRSTRYVDESESPWIFHPLIEKCREDILSLGIFDIEKSTKDLYTFISNRLFDYLSSFQVSKQTARKQSRGAARMYLPNALTTDMIYTASIPQWKEIFSQRLNPGADAEIRHLSHLALNALKKTRYSCYFDDYQTVPSPDGIGVVLST